MRTTTVTETRATTERGHHLVLFLVPKTVVDSTPEQVAVQIRGGGHAGGGAQTPSPGAAGGRQSSTPVDMFGWDLVGSAAAPPYPLAGSRRGSQARALIVASFREPNTVF